MSMLTADMEPCLKQSSNVNQQVMQALMEGVAITDRHGRLVFANQALELLLGYGPGQLLGRSWMALFPEKLCGQAAARQFNKAGQTTGRYEARLLHRDGTTVPVMVSSCALSDSDDSQGTVSTVSDLRERRHLQAQVQKLEKPAMMGQQVASIIHELSNSLTIVFLQTQLLSKNGISTNRVEENLTMIQEQTRRMMQMIDNLRATTDPDQVRVESTDVNALIGQTLDLQKHQLDSDGIQVFIDLEVNLPATQADPDRLQQVLINLINNARQAMSGTQGGELTVSTRVIVEGDKAPARIQIRVADNGSGIPPHVMPHLFKPFFSTKPGEGRGLGLSICERIVQKHEGNIWAENNDKGGATFVLELPVCGQAVSAQASRDITPVSDGQQSESTATAQSCCKAPSAHILVIDDEPMVAVAVGRILQHEGFAVTAATEAQQALDLLDQEKFDLIVSDLKMPNMSGQQFWNAVKDRHPHLANRIIFSTGDSSGRRARGFFEASGCTWIEKPYKPEELIKLIQAALPTSAT